MKRIALLLVGVGVIAAMGCSGDPSEGDIENREKSAKEISDQMDRAKGIEPTKEEGQN
ncbi:MAG: hypothetical protein HONBIEJF_01332 [Fimbriimonadaceae bacterium]|nr:hypothetical protein [Fimbriimonadaceae bacterium]